MKGIGLLTIKYCDWTLLNMLEFTVYVFIGFVVVSILVDVFKHVLEKFLEDKQ